MQISQAGSLLLIVTDLCRQNSPFHMSEQESVHATH